MTKYYSDHFFKYIIFSFSYTVLKCTSPHGLLRYDTFFFKKYSQRSFYLSYFSKPSIIFSTSIKSDYFYHFIYLFCYFFFEIFKDIEYLCLFEIKLHIIRIIIYEGEKRFFSNITWIKGFTYIYVHNL